MLKRILATLFASVLVLSFTSNLSANAEVQEGLTTISSVENYILYLEEQAKLDERAEETLKGFLKLNDEEQSTFIEALQPENYLKLVESSQTNLNSTMTVPLNNGKSVNVKLVIDSSEESTLEDFTNVETKAAVSSTKRVTTGWARVEFYLFDMQLGEYKARLIYQTDANHYALQVYDVEKDHYNLNPGVWTEDVGYTGQYVSGGWAYGGYSWNLRSTGALGAISASLNLYVKGKHPQQEYRLTSSRDDWNIPWTSY